MMSSANKEIWQVSNYEEEGNLHPDKSETDEICQRGQRKMLLKLPLSW